MKTKRKNYEEAPKKTAQKAPVIEKTKEKRAKVVTKSKPRDVRLSDLSEDLLIPPRTLEAFNSVDDVKKAFSLPVTMGKGHKDLAKAHNLALDEAGAFDAIYSSLIQHATDLGQYPITSFLGYGVLQQIAQNGMIRACVQTVADDITREWIQITGGDEEAAKDQEFEGENGEIIREKSKISQLQDFQERKYKLRSLFNQASATVGYMGGAFIFIDTGEDDTTKPLVISKISSELTKDTNVKFVVIDPIVCSPLRFNSINPLSDDYMVPKAWYVLGREVHASRMIPLIDNPPPVLLRPNYNFLGIPQAQILWDYVIHWNSCRVSVTRLLEKISFMVFKTDMASRLRQRGGLDDLDTRAMLINRYRNNSSMVMCDKDKEDFVNIQTSLAGVTDIARQALEFVASINRTPAVKLLGISPSGFNATGESDIRNYNDHIRSKQELKRDAIQKLLDVIQLVEFGEIDESITFAFNKLGEEDLASMAMTMKTKVDSIAVLLDRSVISPDEARNLVKSDDKGGFDSLEGEAPEEQFGELGTEDPSQGNELMQRFLQERQEQPNQPPLDDVDKAGEIEE